MPTDYLTNTDRSIRDGFIPGTRCTWGRGEGYGANSSVTVLDPTRTSRNESYDNGADLGDASMGYVLIEREDGWPALVDGRPTYAWWVTGDDLTRLPTSSDPIELISVAIEMLAVNAAAIEAFRRSTGQSRAFRGCKADTTRALEAGIALRTLASA